jgi:hypothetical protein
LVLFHTHEWAIKKRQASESNNPIRKPFLAAIGLKYFKIKRFKKKEADELPALMNRKQAASPA